MKFVVTGVAALCAAAVIGIHAQDKMGPDQMGKMEKHDQSYTGCVEAGKAPRTYVLTHVAATEDHMGKGEMAKDAMAKDAMGMGHDAMSPTTLVVSSKGCRSQQARRPQGRGQRRDRQDGRHGQGLHGHAG